MAKRCQRPVRGGRRPLPSCVLQSIRAKVEALAAAHDVSKSFVVAVALADAFGITEQESYLEEDNKTSHRAKKRGARR